MPETQRVTFSSNLLKVVTAGFLLLSTISAGKVGAVRAQEVSATPVVTEEAAATPEITPTETATPLALVEITPTAEPVVEEEGSGYYYYVEGERVALTPSLEWVSVQFASGDVEAQVQALEGSGIMQGTLEEARTIPYPEVTLVRLVEGLSEETLVAGMQALSDESSGFRQVLPLFETADAEMAVTDEFIATFPAGMSQEEINLLNTANGVELVEAILGQEDTFVLRVTGDAALDALGMANLYQESGAALYAGPNFLRILPPGPQQGGEVVAEEELPDGISALGATDPYFPWQWYLQNTQQYGYQTSYDADIDAPEAWEITTGSPDVVIAIVDEGVDLAHEDLRDNLVAGYDATGRGGSGAPEGNNAHGTNVAGIAAAVRGNGIGIAGVCPECSIMPVRIGYTDSEGYAVIYNSWAANGIAWAYQHGADILNCSWGGGSESTVINTAIANARAYGRGGLGSVVVFAAGNYMDSINSPVSYPATLNNVIAVGALSLCDERKNGYSDLDSLCIGYEYGWSSCYGSELDLSAPGVWLYSTDLMGSAGYSTGGYFSLMNGTSGAAPMVSGVAGLVLALDPGLTAGEVQTLLQDTADDVNPTHFISGWDGYIGYGRVNAYRAVSELASATFHKISPENGVTGLSSSPTLSWTSTGESGNYEYCVDTVDNDTCDTAWVDTGIDTSIQLAGLAPAASYYWQVRAIAEDGTTYADGSSANWWSFTTLGLAPGTFERSSPLSGSSGYASSVTLAWGSSSNATQYQYCFDRVNNRLCDGAWTSAGSSTAVTLSGLAAGATYYWQVRAVNASGTVYAGGLSTSWWSFTLAGGIPGTFYLRSPSGPGNDIPDRKTLEWEESSDTLWYEYCVDAVDNNTCDTSWINNGNLTWVTVYDPGTNPFDQYYWSVRARNNYGTTYAGWGWVSFDTGYNSSGIGNPRDGAQPTDPTLIWASYPGALSYEYCLQTSSSSTCTTTWVSTSANTWVHLTGLARGQTYRWTVRATTAAGLKYIFGEYTSWPSFTVSAMAATDGFEPDNNYEEAKTSGTNSRSIYPAGDEDWIKFTVTYASIYRISTSGTSGGDTRIWLYDSSLNLLEFNDNNGNNTYSTIQRECGAEPLPAGTYYVKVDGNGHEIPNYTISISVGNPCDPGEFTKEYPVDGETGVTTAPTLAWEDTDVESSFYYCIDVYDNDACDTGWVSAGTAPSIGLSDLNLNTTYYWQIYAENHGLVEYADEPSPAWWSFTTQGDGSPGNFNKASPASGLTGLSTRPTLYWDASSGASSYEICYDSVDNDLCDTEWIDRGSGSSADLSGLTSGTMYYWQVRAVNESGTTYADGSTESWWSFTPQQSSLPGYFERNSPADETIGVAINPTLSWNASSGAVRYEYCLDSLYVGNNTNNYCRTPWIDNGNSTSVTITGLLPSKEYYWQVRAVNANGISYSNGAGSPVWSFVVQDGAAGPFDKISPDNGSAGFFSPITLEWSSSNRADGSYEYCIDTVNNNLCDSSWITVNYGNSVDISGLAFDTTYYWQVRTMTSGGWTTYANGPSSAWWSFSSSDVPGAFSRFIPENNRLDEGNNTVLMWNTSQFATEYQYCIDNIDNSVCDTGWVDTGTNTWATISGLTSGATYYWQVRAFSGLEWTYAEGSPASFGRFTVRADEDAANDAFASALNITAVPYSNSQDIAAASVADNDPAFNCVAGRKYNTVWYRYTPSTSGNLTVDTLGSDYDTVLAIWTGSQGALQSQRCDDDSRAPQSQVEMAVTAGTTYYIEVASYSETSIGTLNLNVQQTATGAPRAFYKTSPVAGVTDLETTSVNLYWERSNGATSYAYCYDTSNDHACSNWVSTGSNTSAYVSGLTLGTTYYWQVRATNASGTSYANGTGRDWSFNIRAPRADMEARGFNVSIANGDISPSAVDDTHFGSVQMLDSGGSITRTFTLYNHGEIDLVFDGETPVTVSGANAADFTVTDQPDGPVAPGGSTTFTVVFTPAETGGRSAVITIASNDPRRSPFTFAVQGDSNYLLYMPFH